MTCRRGALGAIWVVPPIKVRTCGDLLPAYTPKERSHAPEHRGTNAQNAPGLMDSDDRPRGDSRYYPPYSRTQSRAVQVQSGADGFEPPDTNPDPCSPPTASPDTASTRNCAPRV